MGPWVSALSAGAAVDILWLVFLGGLGICEIIPGFIVGGIAAVVVTLLTLAPSEEVVAVFEKVASGEEL